MIVELKGHELFIGDLDLYADAFKTVEMYDELAFLRLNSENDSLLGSAGDIVISVTGINIVIAYSIRENGIKLSTRSINPKIKANDLVRYVAEGYGVGGGHAHMAGGFIPKENFSAMRAIDTFIKYRAISYYDNNKG